MPKKYHRPPAAKRRKAKKTNIPYLAEPLPSSDGGAAVTVAEEAPPEPEIQRPSTLPAEDGAGAAPRETAVKHLTRDYSYIRGEVARILLISGFLIAALLITALFRG